MNREEALALVQGSVKNKNLVKHHLAVEAVMQALARHFGEDEETWRLVGLLHDADYELTEKDPKRHGLVMAEKLEAMGVDPVIVHAIKSHNEELGVLRQSRLEKSLYACDELTGLIVAAALVHPEKKLAPLDVPFILNRFKEKGFARGARREQIMTCSEIGFTLDEFIALSLKAMQGIAGELGL
jgi:putative nucleotidyltransferase with HDIG domain